MLIIYIDCRERFHFFKRLAPALAQLGQSITWITPHLSVYRLFNKAQRDAAFPNSTIKLARASRQAQQSLPDLAHTREVIASTLSLAQAQRLGGAILNVLQQIEAQSPSPISGLWVWNGTDIAGAVARSFASQRQMPTLFLEIANLPGKLFADPAGTNAQSALASDAQQLDAMPADVEAFRSWRATYIERKLGSHVVPQARSVGRFSPLYAVDMLGQWVGLPRTQNRSAVALLTSVYRRKALSLPVDRQSPPDEPFVLFPMQVSNDSQLLLNSDVDNEGALEQAAAFAASQNMKLLIKPHPAEKDAAFLERFIALQKAHQFEFVAGNTFSYLAAAAHVFVINSTAGLEAMILQRPTTFVGRSFYPALNNDQRLAAYLQSYLIDIDYFGDEAITPAHAQQLLDRMAMQAQD